MKVKSMALSKDSRAALSGEQLLDLENRFKRYTYMLFIGAQLSRLIYCDTGIAAKVINAGALGMPNDIVNKVISAYDAKYAAEKKLPLPPSENARGARPMQSYLLQKADPDDKVKYATYISTPDDMTCIVMDSSKFAENPSMPILPTDIFVIFKGTSTMAGMKHDLMSVGPGTDLGKLAGQIGVKISPGEGGPNNVPASFIQPVIRAWKPIMQAIKYHMKSNTGVRLFVTGHSLGGAFATLFSFIMAEGKVTGTVPAMKNIKNIHLITYGAPTTLSDVARNTFNKHLEPAIAGDPANPANPFSLMTLDRVVSQLTPARSASGQSLQGAAILLGPSDGVPTVPAGFSHPGFRPLATDINPESGGRPYTFDKVRQFYGLNSKDRSFRDGYAWPFGTTIDYDSIHKKAEVQEIVNQITGGLSAPEESLPDTAQLQEEADMPLESSVKATIGAGIFTSSAKDIYNQKTKEHIPDFLSIRGSKWASGFAHAEYFGMFFVKALRKPGMKNPASGTDIAYFGLYPSGVKIQWFDQATKSSVANYMPITPTTMTAAQAQAKPGLTDYMRTLLKERRVSGGRSRKYRNKSKSNKTRRYK
jgi:hypothetical protein